MRGWFHRLVGFFVAAGIFVVVPFAAPSATLRVGSDVSGAPFEFFAPNSHAMLGLDVDLLQAVSVKLGEPVAIFNHRFDDLLSAVRRGKFDLAMSAISDTRSREGLVDFIDYFLAGGGIMVPANNPHRIFAIDALCGFTVTVEKGTSYEATLRAQSTDCKNVGLGAIRVSTFATDDAAFAAFARGNAAAYVTDFPVGAFRVRAKGGRAYAMAGSPFDVVPYGIAVSKKNVTVRAAVQRALVAVIADGEYDRLLKKWGLLNGALRSVPINAGTLFQK